ncbi:serine/threonine-protein kinase RIO3-like [Littorina saxatilis]|uniref:Serine/threonine-protein kinase RIO3 n=1 Tax=Littorina saxatilis TaxID=31220 RepID=A0AAN9AQF2_9CAEN
MSAPQVSSPWGKKAQVIPCSLEDVMSEQLASDLQNDSEDTEFKKAISESTAAAATSTVAPPDIDSDDMAAILAAAGISEGESNNDEIIARMMQLQFDREHNTMLDREANKYNGGSKVTISFENYKTKHPVYDEAEEDDDDEEEENYAPPKTKWEESPPKIGVKGYTGSGKNITTKHDKVICGRKNAERLMEFPPEFESGDGEGMDMQLPNRVYNKLKKHSIAENKRSTRHSDKKEQSTAEHVLDPKTRTKVFRLVNRGVIESLGGVIAGGKESLVFQAKGGSVEGMDIPEHLAVKIYKTTLMDFRTREKYVHGDHRFSKDDYKKQNPRKIIKIWATKEVANLNRMRKFDVPCPSVIILKDHILVMSLVGSHQTPAPKLRYANLSVPDLQDAYEQTVAIMKTLHHKCALVHADLSDYNLLWSDGTVYVIDVSQSVDLTHPQAFNFLYRDCYNVCNFFEKQNVHNVLSPEQLFNEVTDLDIQGEGADFSAQVQRYDKERKETDMVLGHNYSQFGFDYFFEKAQQFREAELAAMAGSSSDATKKSLTEMAQKYRFDSDDSDSEEGEGGEEV